MSLSTQARDAGKFFDNAKESKTPAVKLPPQVTKYMEDGKLASDAAVKNIKAAIQGIYAREMKEILNDSHADANDPQVKQKLNQAKYRYYGKTELAAEMKVSEEDMAEKVPYGVDFISAVINGEQREVYCFKLPGLGNVDEDHLDADATIALETKLLGIGGAGKVIPLSNMDNPAEVFAVKIKNFRPGDNRSEALAIWEADAEYQHALAANLAFGRCLRKSPSHDNELQERIYMYFVPGIKLCDYIDLHARKLQSLQVVTLFYNIAMAIKEGSHQFDAVHRDLKDQNFHIVAKTLACRLLDFGYQRKLTNGVYGDAHCVGSLESTAPELWRAMKEQKEYQFTLQTDLFAYGVIVANTLNQLDFEDVGVNDVCEFATKLRASNGFKLLPAVSNTFRLLFPDEAARNHFFVFLKSLMNDDPGKRPKSIDECIEFFDTLGKYLRALKTPSGASAHLEALKKLAPLQVQQTIKKDEESDDEYSSRYDYV